MATNCGSDTELFELEHPQNQEGLFPLPGYDDEESGEEKLASDSELSSGESEGSGCESPEVPIHKAGMITTRHPNCQGAGDTQAPLCHKSKAWISSSTRSQHENITTRHHPEGARYTQEPL